ncbi:MAG: hypothetical protein GKR86_15365, partial [Ilumatobacter sp.]|nr:hypothetical protein [Ilumatobacter sp.]
MSRIAITDLTHRYADAVVHEVMARFESVPSVVALGHADRLSGPDRLEILDDLRSMVGERPVLAVAVPKDAPPTGLEELGSVLAEVEASPVDNATLAVVQRAAEAVGRDPEPLPSEAWAAAEESAVGGMDGQVASARERLERAGRRQALMGRFDAEPAASTAQPPRPPQTWDPALPVVSAALEYWEAAAAELSGGVEHAQLLL